MDPHRKQQDQIVTPDQPEELPNTLPLLILTGQVAFPMSVMPIQVQAEAEVKLLNDVVIGSKMLGLVAARDPEDGKKGVDNAYEVGCVARVLQMQHLAEGGLHVLVQALKRMRITGVEQQSPYLVASVDPVEDITPSEDLEPLARTVKMQVHRLIELSPSIPDEANAMIDNIEDPGVLADIVASNLNLTLDEKQRLLETLDKKARLDSLTRLLAREVEMLELSTKIQNDVKSTIDANQREYFLRQQLKAIKEELGESEKGSQEIEEYREKLDALQLPESIDKEARRELKRLEQMNEASAEYHVILTYLDWFVNLPWKTETEDRLDLELAEQILNEDHFGLDKVKRRILEYLAVRKLKADASGPILCFVGAPGVGKTSLGQSIARALGRKFVRMSLGGMRDEAEIRGHRRTYVGAMPGRIIQNISKADSKNPVFMLDEIDKLGADFRGDPSSALLEVLDPAQNHTFSDLYLNVPFDLSRVMFIATANVLDTIPWALRDRMEVIEIPGYTQEEKLEIALRYLVPRQLEAHGIPKKKLRFHKAALKKIINDYTREAGVRNLDREIANVCRGCAREFAQGREKPIAIAPEKLKEFLGPEKVYHEVAERTRIPGVATGLAWTATGGDLLFIEATRMPGKGELILTGQLGEVMKESAQAVLSYIRTNAKRLGLEDVNFKEYDIHLHVPAGAVPKDGPSAGVSMLAAVASLLLEKRIKYYVAMTGEITLRGNVLPVGGIKEKVLAGSRGGIKEVILPKRNEPNLEDVPDTVKKKMKFHFVSHMDEVLEIALGISL